MKKTLSLLIAIILVLSLLLSACASATISVNTETLYQTSTLNSLMAGNYDGVETISDVLKHGDTGLGTFDKLDGEMIVLDGKVYQVKSTGKVESPDSSIKTPFMAVTHFDADINQQTGPINDLDTLKKELDQLILKKDRFYAIRINGQFDAVQVRSVPPQEKPYPVLSDVTKNQPVFDYTNIKGTLVGFWCPEYVGGINAPGYHLHFISDDRSKGGHLLAVKINNATITLDETANFEMELGNNNQQTGNISDIQSEIEKVEQ
ncbi:MAG: acetolactate decarboxylase [Anaerolineae bacterium]|nr:acetolactate decarboxylase [Anaerolineae bacterium]